MKLLFTQDTDWLIRNPAQQHHLAEMLSLRGHEVRVIDFELLWRTQGKRELYSRREIFNDVAKIHNGVKIKVIRPGIIKVFLLDYVSLLFSHRKELDRQINEFKPDLIVGWGILNSYLAMKAARENNIPFLYYWIDVLHRLIPFKPFQPIGKIIESRVLRQADRVLVINEKLRDYVIKLGARPERTQVLRAGINLEQFKPNINLDAIRKQYRFKEEDIILFFMGWLYRFSGLKEITSRLAGSKNNKFKLLIVGEGDAHEELQEIRERFNLQDRVILTGKKSYHEIPNLITAANICLLPAYPWEPIMQDIVPIKMYEYMAMQKPVISTKLPGVMKEFGEDNGVVYVDRPEDVVPKAIELVQNGKVEELGAKARSFVEKYSWDNITDDFEKILENVINVIKEKHG
jgi:glycosyltransferase involved in cell wall biosynthesis